MAETDSMVGEELKLDNLGTAPMPEVSMDEMRITDGLESAAETARAMAASEPCARNSFGALELTLRKGEYLDVVLPYACRALVTRVSPDKRTAMLAVWSVLVLHNPASGERATHLTVRSNEAWGVAELPEPTFSPTGTEFKLVEHVCILRQQIERKYFQTSQKVRLGDDGVSQSAARAVTCINLGRKTPEGWTEVEK